MLRIEREGDLGAYGSVPIAFAGSSRLDLAALPELVEVPVAAFVKDYDGIAGEAPPSWPLWFDTSRWGIFAAFEGEARVGGVAAAFDAPVLEILEGRRDLASVWDLRVAPSARGRGVGRALWGAALEWARGRGCVETRVETQDVNVAACRFYRAMGCSLVSVEPGAYPGVSSGVSPGLDEARLVWEFRLGTA